VLSVIEKVVLRPGQVTVTSNSCNVTASVVVLPGVDPADVLVLPSVDPELLAPPSVVPDVLATAAVAPVVAS
jgi:hypothetical protein